MYVYKHEIWVEGKDMKIASTVKSHQPGAPAVTLRASFWNGKILGDKELAEQIVKEMHFLTAML